MPQHLMTQCMTFIELIAKSPGHPMGQAYSGQQAAGIDMLTSVPTKKKPSSKVWCVLGLGMDTSTLKDMIVQLIHSGVLRSMSMSGGQEGQSRMSFAAECNHELLMFTKRREYINSRVCFYRLNSPSDGIPVYNQEHTTCRSNQL